MKTSHDFSHETKVTAPRPTPWYRVRPAILGALALGLSAWLGVLIDPATRDLVLAQLLPTLTRWSETGLAALPKYGPAILNALAAGSVVLAIAGSWRRLRPLRRKIERSLRLTLRLQPSSRTVRA